MTNLKKAVLVVSFGTAYNDTRDKTIGAVERKIANAFPLFDQRRAFTSEMVINKLRQRDGEVTDNVSSALQRLANEGYGCVVIQPTHVMNGDEYDKMRTLAKPYEDKFELVKYGAPLLTSSDDYEQVVSSVAADIPQLADKSCAVVFMGHGSEHYANAAYAALDYRFKAMGYANAFVGTVEGYPDFEKISNDLADFKPQKVVLVPLMIVAGDHAINDMASDSKNSWKNLLKNEGYDVECILKGLGEYSGIQDIFVKHCSKAITEVKGNGA